MSDNKPVKKSNLNEATRGGQNSSQGARKPASQNSHQGSQDFSERGGQETTFTMKPPKPKRK